jgi:DNA primase catalytic core, N-terminal domain./CHC2 zinc finger.
MDSQEYEEYAAQWEQKRIDYQAKQRAKAFRSSHLKVNSGNAPQPTNDRDKIEEIKSKLDIIEVIGRDVSLSYKGNGDYVGTVGATGHSGESLKVSKSLQTWKDFKNGPGGDVFDWIGYTNGLDVRGADFPEVLRITADLAGVELEEITEQERNAAKEKVDIHNLYTEAAEIYHKNLTPELYSFVQEKWGITRETIDNLKIGYATAGRDLHDLDTATLKKSGLVFVNNGMMGGEIFQGRITFPYWKDGKVVYLIGRETEETPEPEREKGMKYKKLLVHKEGHEYVSPTVHNSYFYGEDYLRGSDYCIITEGVADCVATLQAGFPCISPVTVRFREQDHPKLLSLVKGLEHVYICNDNEANEAGLKGALCTAEVLESEGIEARLIELPKLEGVDKIDIADYMKEHTPDDFKELIDSSVRLWDYKLSKQVIKPSSTSLERLRAFKTFISNDIHLMQDDEWEVFVNNEVFKKFDLSKNDIKTAVAEVKRGRGQKQITKSLENKNLNKQVDERNNHTGTDEIDIDEIDIPQEERDAARLKAIDILKNDDPIKYTRDTIEEYHVGDEQTEECICVSIAGQSCLNTDVIQTSVNGESGSGKSHLMKIHMHLVPEKYKAVTSLSPKAAYYMDLKPGTIIFSDDTTPSEEMEEVIKRSTTNYQEYTKHTIVRDGKPETFNVPPRINWYLTSVDSEVSIQLLNRQLTFNTSNDPEHKNDIFKMQLDKAEKGEMPVIDVTERVLVCRRIYDIIKSQTFKVKIPFAKRIEIEDKSNSRVSAMLLDMIKGYTIFFHMQRETDEDGYLLATEEDFDKAKKLFESQTEGIVSKLNVKERDILRYIKNHPKCIIQDIAEKTGYSYATVRNILKGRPKSKSAGEGLLEKVKGLSISEEIHTTEEDEKYKISKKAERFVLSDKFDGWSLYTSKFITLKPVKE